jgi:Tfp pilus assembly protein PilN
MPQQINLSTPVLLAQKRYFSAQTMVLSLLVFLVAGLAMTAYGLWSLQGLTTSLQATLSTRQPELARLREAVARGRADAGADDKQVAQQLQAARDRLNARQMVLAELQHGLLAPGRGHSARMQLVAQTIPPQAWVTAIQADGTQFEVRGFTQEPAVLNDWVGQLARSPVLAGQQLARVKVERAPGERPLWSFSLGSVASAREARP